MKSTYLFLLVLTTFLIACSTKPEKPALPDLSHLYQVPTGKPVTLVFAAYKTTMIANGEDHCKLRISVADSVDKEIMDANLPFEISVKGDAIVTEPDGSSPELVSKSDTMTVWKSQITDGIKLLRLQVGKIAGKIYVEAKTKGLWPASHEIHTIPANVVLLKPTPDQIKPKPNVEPKMIGADISFLPQLESHGMRFFDNRKEEDAFHILKNHGMNYIRLRIFVNPENEQGYSPGIGFCGLDSTLKMAKRVKDAGMHFLLDFHYSDTWADPQKQFKPKAWEGLGFNDLTTALHDYTKSVLLKMKEQGTLPDMVQIGNEINHGIVWPDGYISHPDQLADLLKAGVNATHEVDPSIAVMMHLALGGQNKEAVFWLDNMIARGVDFDIIGLSYYPRWHCTLDDLNFNMHDLIKRYQKDVNVVEYSAFKKEVHDLVFNLPDNRGNGACIWEPLNTWSRILDRQGNTLPEINIYDQLSKKYIVNNPATEK